MTESEKDLRIAALETALTRLSEEVVELRRVGVEVINGKEYRTTCPPGLEGMGNNCPDHLVENGYIIDNGCNQCWREYSSIFYGGSDD